MESKRPLTARILGPSALVARELLRALAGALALPFRALDYWIEHDGLREELRADLGASPHLSPSEAELALPQRPLRVFLSCAETSGEIHALNLVAAMRRVAGEAGAPPPQFVGLGGPALAEAGVELVGDPVSRSAMGLVGVLGALPFYLGLVHSAARTLRDGQVDVFVPVDSPALHVPLGHIAKSCGVRTVHFVTPQYWGWAPWRVRGYRGAVDLALSILPFEPAWFARRGVNVAHVGHPLLDELGAAPLRNEAGRSARPGRVVVLPGSRRSVIRRNLPTMLAALEGARGPGEELEVVIAQRDSSHAALFEELLRGLGASDRVRLAFGELESELAEAQLALSVSGTILLHLFHQRLPAVVVYRAEHERQLWMARQFLTAPWFSSVNLLAGRELFPEFFFRDPVPSPELLAAVDRGLHDAGWRAEVRAQLEETQERLGPPGATRRAALAVLAPWRAARTDARTTSPS